MKKFELKFGYTQTEDGEKVVHKQVVIGKRPTAEDYIAASEKTELPTMFKTLLYATAITKFGSLKMPCPHTVILSLNHVDRQILEENFQNFIHETADTSIINAGELSGHYVILQKPAKIKGKTVQVLKFEKLLTGYDEIAIEGLNLTPAREQAARIANQLVLTDGTGGVTAEDLASLDAMDYQNLLIAEASFLNSFRG